MHIFMAARREYAKERHICFKLCRELSSDSYPTIGAACYDRDHTSIMYGVTQATRLLADKRNQQYIKLYNKIESQLIEEAACLKNMGWL